MKNKKFIFIDESGDPGFGPGGSQHFVMCGIVFETEEKMCIADEVLKQLHIKLSQRNEFKFSNVNPKKKVVFFDLIKSCNFQIVAIVCEKLRFASMQKDFYRFVLKLLLNEIMLYNSGCGELSVYLDGDKNKQKMLNAHLRQNNISCRLHMYDSRKYNLIQLADMFSGAILCGYKEGKNYTKDFDIKIVEVP